MPGSLLGYDRAGNVVCVQVVGQLDGEGLLRTTKISDLYRSMIGESEGVMGLIRQVLYFNSFIV